MSQRDAQMYIIPGIPEDQHFEPQVRKEIKVYVVYMMYCLMSFIL